MYRSPGGGWLAPCSGSPVQSRLLAPQRAVEEIDRHPVNRIWSERINSLLMDPSMLCRVSKLVTSLEIVIIYTCIALTISDLLNRMNEFRLERRFSSNSEGVGRITSWRY